MVTSFGSLALLKIKRSLLKGGRDHDKRHFTAGFAKFSCAAKNAELPRGSGLGKLGQASKGNLSLIKDSREKALYDVLSQKAISQIEVLCWKTTLPYRRPDIGSLLNGRYRLKPTLQ